MQSSQILHPQLGEIKTQLDAASQKAASIVDGVAFEQLKKRPQPNHWSIAECLIHLNLSSQAEIEVLDDVFASAAKENSSNETKYKMDLLGRFLKWTLEPPPLFFSKMKTTEPFQPIEVEPVGEVLPTFLDLQEQLKERADRANGLPLDRIKVVSPFDRRVKYNLLSCFHILLAHERRHLWQAEQIKTAIGQ